jgi:rhodanese-related sulfurtransferase
MFRNYFAGKWALILVAVIGFVATAAVEAQANKPASVDVKLPKEKQTTLGLYVTAAQAYEKWKAAPDKVKIIDVRTPEEYAFVGHPEMVWNIPLAFVTYQRKAGRIEYGSKMNPDFVALVQEVAQPTDTLLLMCRSGGRSAMAVNKLAAAGFKNVYNITDGMEGDKVKDPESVFHGKRMKNGWKNSGLPWVYTVDPEKIILLEGGSKQRE